MRRIPRPLLILHTDAVFRERVRAAARSAYAYASVSTWGELFEAVPQTSAAAVVVVDPYADEGGRRSDPSPQLGALLRQFPSVTVLAAMEVRPNCFDHVRVLSEWGVVQVICLDEEETPISIARRLESARGRPLRRILERHLPPNTSGYARAVLGAAVEVVVAGGQAADLARSLHVTGRTLTRWCRRSGLPAPRQLLAWLRILLAAELLDDPGRSVLDVALSCGYSADSSLRHVLYNFVGMSPSRLRRRGAFAVASRAFTATLAGTRTGLRVG